MYTQQQQNLFIVFTSVLILVSVLFLGGCSGSSDSSDNVTSPSSDEITFEDLVGTWGLIITSDTAKTYNNTINAVDYSAYTRVMVVNSGGMVILKLPDGSDAFQGRIDYNEATNELVVTAEHTIEDGSYTYHIYFEGRVTRKDDLLRVVEGKCWTDDGWSGKWTGEYISSR